MDIKNQYNSTNITSQTTTLVATGNGVLHSITLNKPVAGSTIAFYNGIDSGGVLLGTITSPTGPQPVTLTYDIAFAVGLAVVTGTHDQDITITWSQG